MTPDTEPAEPEPTAEDPKIEPEPTAEDPKTEPEPTAEDPRTEPETTADHKGRGSRHKLVLTVAVVVLLVLSAVLTGLFVNASNTIADRNRALAARTADRDALKARLVQMQTQNADLQAKLKAAEDKALDPQGYELIKKCVTETADMDRQLRQLLAGVEANNSAWLIVGGHTVPALPTLPETTPCMNGEKFLK